MSEPINLMVVDLSHWDDGIDYPKLLAGGIVGVIYKATEDETYGDPTYHQAKAEAIGAGLLWGSYHFGTGDNAHEQVVNYLNYADPAPSELFCLDFEENTGGPTMTIDQAAAWISEVESELNRAGQCVLYSGNLIKEAVTGPSTFWGGGRLWLAQYSDTPVLPAAWSKYWLWQYTDGQDGPRPHTTAGAPPDGVDCNSYKGTPEQLRAEWATGGLEVIK